MLPNFKINSDFTYLDELKIAKNSNSPRLYKRKKRRKKSVVEFYPSPTNLRKQRWAHS